MSEESQAPSPPEQQPLAPEGGKPPKAETNMALLCHLLPLANYAVPIPFGNIVAALVVWLIKKDEMPFVNDQGKESLNFQITVTIAYIAAIVLCFVMVGFLLLPVIGVLHVVFAIIATVKSSNGEYYRYPICLRFVK